MGRQAEYAVVYTHIHYGVLFVQLKQDHANRRTKATACSKSVCHMCLCVCAEVCTSNIRGRNCCAFLQKNRRSVFQPNAARVVSAPQRSPRPLVCCCAVPRCRALMHTRAGAAAGQVFGGAPRVVPGAVTGVAPDRPRRSRGVRGGQVV